MISPAHGFVKYIIPARLIRSEAQSLIGADTERCAGLIVAQLAHVHGLAPLASSPSPPDREQEQLKEALRAMCQFTGEASRTRPLLMEARRRAIELCGYVDGFGPVREDSE